MRLRYLIVQNVDTNLKTGKIEELVNEMLEKVRLSVKGVIYMDDIYW